MKFILRLIGLSAALTVAQVNAGNLPSGYPADGFDRIGVVESVDFNTRKIVVNDVEYTLRSDVVLHSKSSASDSLGRLIPGSKLGLNFMRSGGQRYISEMWLLPSTFQPSEKHIKSYDRPLKPGLLK